MPIRITCPSCFQQFKVADRFAGRKGRCPNEACKQVFQVPQIENEWEEELQTTAPLPRTRTAQTPKKSASKPNWMIPASVGGGVLSLLAVILLVLSDGSAPTVELPTAEANSPATPQAPLDISTQLVSLNAAAPTVPPKQTVKRLDEAALKDDHSFESEVVPFLKNYCYDCHEGSLAEAGVQFDLYETTADVLQDRKRWESILSVLQIGAMPPSDATQPPEEDRMKVSAWLDTKLFEIDCDSINDPGRETIQRLNLVEYTNTVRDLFGIDDLDPTSNFPADDVGEGFDNIGDVLSLPPLLMEKYLAAAEEITDRVIADRFIIPTVRKDGSEMQTEGSASGNRGGVSFPSRGTATANFKFAKQGEYILRIQASATQAGSDPAELGIEIGGKPFKLVKIKEHRQSDIHEFKFKGLEGDYPISVSFLNDYYNKDAKNKDRRDRNLFVHWVELEGPLSGVAVNPPEHDRRIVIAEPDGNLSVKAAARKVFSNILPQAFRRPVTDEEVEPFAALVEHTVNEFGESYEEGIRLGLQAMLVSPSFLFRVEETPDPDNADLKHEISDYDLASRLSYFLWSSMPDQELFVLAEQGTLSEPDVLEQQVHRMLADPKSRALVENFGGQWLNLRNLDEISFDRRRFKSFDEKLRVDMVEETLAFLDHIIREDLSILEFLTAEYTFVNERLAKHYGLENIAGEQFQKVSLQGTPRAGVLTQASILALTSNPTRTSPVKRGKWIMDNILGTPPPPAPAGVPELEETAKASPNATLAEQLALHREDPGCASCHNQMDPLGLAFEKFDAVGRFREREGKKPIDDSGVMPDGQEFTGSLELIEILSEKKDLFSRNLAEKMLTYALGRGLKYYDRCAINSILERVESNQYQFSSLVLGVVNSEPFRMRRGDGGVE